MVRNAGGAGGRLLTEESETRSRGSGIGLKNVHQRIQLYFEQSTDWKLKK